MAERVHTVAVIGAGKMGETMLSGLLRAGWPASELVATVRRPERADQLRDQYGIRVLSNDEAIGLADVVVIAVCAGLPTAFFEKRLPSGTPVVRVMSNTPALVDEAMTAISAGSHATAEHLALAEEMFRPLGRTIRMPEAQQDAVVADRKSTRLNSSHVKIS